MAQEFTALTATGATDWIKILGPTTVRTKGTWVGSAQPQIRSPGDADETNLGEAMTANDAFKVDLAKDETAEVRFDYTHTSGEFEAEVM